MKTFLSVVPLCAAAVLSPFFKVGWCVSLIIEAQTLAGWLAIRFSALNAHTELQQTQWINAHVTTRRN